MMKQDNEPRIIEWNHYSDFMGTDTVCRVDPTKKETALIVKLLRDMQAYMVEFPPIGSTPVSIISSGNDTEALIQILETDVSIKELTREQVNLLVGGVTFIISISHSKYPAEMNSSEKEQLDINTVLMEAFLLRIGHKGFYNI